MPTQTSSPRIRLAALVTLGFGLMLGLISDAALIQAAPDLKSSGPNVIQVLPAHQDVSRPVRELSQVRLSAPSVTGTDLHLPGLRSAKPSAVADERASLPDYALLKPAPSLMPSTTVNFDALRNTDNNISGGTGPKVPSNQNADVGPNHIVEMVNNVYAVYSKAGATLVGPTNTRTLWSGFGGSCETQNDGDPIVLYDRMADRWLLSVFAVPPGGPSLQCIAVSQTPDPTGAYYRYSYTWPGNKFNDYPKFGIWPDGYYLSVNQFTQDLLTYQGVGVAAIDRSKMLVGDSSATLLYVDLATSQGNSFSLLPSNLIGSALPDLGTPNYFAEVEDTSFGFGTDRIQIFEFHADFVNVGSSSFTGPTVLNVASFDPDICPGARERCIPQPGTGEKLEALSDRAMSRLNVRNMGAYQSMLISHTVDVLNDGTGNGRAGLRWYELRRDTGAWALQQGGNFSPDADHRWVPSMASDNNGNFAVGYSVSSGTTFPSIKYSGRLATEPLNQLGQGPGAQGEATLIAGAGSQETTNSFWGSYTSMSIDPVDDCTFWYTNQYYQASSPGNWVTRIGSFKYPSCVAKPVTSVGVFRPSNGLLFLKNSNTTGFAESQIVFGIPNDKPVAGDWNSDGVDSIGVYRDGAFYLRNTNTTGFADVVASFGIGTDLPVVGDWDGNGTDTMGIYRNGLFILRNSNTTGPGEIQFALGIPGDVPIGGDWNGDGVDTTGVFRPSNGLIYLKNQNTTGFADVEIVFGIPNDKPMVGDWNGDGVETIGVYRNGQVFLRNTNTTGFANLVFALGITDDVPITGNWDGRP